MSVGLARSENAMRYVTYTILCLALIAQASPSLAEYLQGTVVAIDRGRGELEIVVSAEGRANLEGSQGSADEEGRQLNDKPRRIVVKAAWFPHCLRAGSEVYARGDFVDDSSDFFEAEDVFLCRRRGDQDPTGVRSRFQHHRRRMMHHRGGDMHE